MTAPPAGQFGNPGPGEPYNGASSPADLDRPLYGATMGQAVSRFFKKYATFSGRASRSEYWWLSLFMLIIAVVFGVLFGIIVATSAQAMDDTGEIPGAAIALLVVMFLFGLATIVPTLALQWRRLHDANLAGPFYFLSFIPSIGGIIVFVLSVLPPKPEGRRFDRF